MNLIVMIVTACLSGGACRDFPVPLDESISMHMCVQQGQIGLAEWAAGHPAYSIRRWRCETAGHHGAA